jgi:hypothetical protein
MKRSKAVKLEQGASGGRRARTVANHSLCVSHFLLLHDGRAQLGGCRCQAPVQHVSPRLRCLRAWWCDTARQRKVIMKGRCARMFKNATPSLTSSSICARRLNPGE